MSKLKFKSLIIAIFTYFFILIAIIFVLYQGKQEPIKAKNYVEKKSETIEVSIGSSMARKSNNSKKKSKSKEKITKKKKVIKKVRNNKKTTKKIVKKSYKKAKKTIKKTITKKTQKTVSKKANANKLFGSIKNLTKENKIDNNKKSGHNGKDITKRDKAKGEENAYFAKVQNTLKGWPAQSNFAGEKIRVELTIYQSGLFDYKILYKSLNPEFNVALKRYLEQLKRFGFGVHNNPKPYKVIVEFIAK